MGILSRQSSHSLYHQLRMNWSLNCSKVYQLLLLLAGSWESLRVNHGQRLLLVEVARIARLEAVWRIVEVEAHKLVSINIGGHLDWSLRNSLGTIHRVSQTRNSTQYRGPVMVLWSHAHALTSGGAGHQHVGRCHVRHQGEAVHVGHVTHQHVLTVHHTRYRR